MKAPAPREAPPRSYMRLVRIFPLVPIRDEDHARDASRMLTYVLALGQEDRGVADYVDVLSGLIESYEQREPIRDGSVAGALEMMMEQRGISRTQLERDVGIAPATIANVLRGDRDFNADQASRLGAFFCVRPGVFLPSSASQEIRPR